MTKENFFIESLLGTIYTECSTRLQTLEEADNLTGCYEIDQYEHDTAYNIRPAPWLIRLGLGYGLYFGLLSSSTQGWKTSLNTFRPVPDDSLIFKLCKQGNVLAVRKLLSEARHQSETPFSKAIHLFM